MKLMCTRRILKKTQKNQWILCREDLQSISEPELLLLKYSSSCFVVFQKSFNTFSCLNLEIRYMFYSNRSTKIMALLLDTQHFKDCGKNWIDLFESYLDSNWVGLGKILLFLNFLFFPSILPSSSTIFSWPVDADILMKEQWVMFESVCEF